jgi:preprotein translocase subunit SecG
MTWLLIIAIIVSILLMLVILVQNPKGGGLASNFSQGNQIFGVEKTTDIVEKITWIGALLLVVISLAAASYMNVKKPTKANTAAPAAAQDIKIPDIKVPKK